jgi:DNA polymerase/3'-5' exonuclease PolX
MTKLEELQKSCELGLIDRVKELSKEVDDLTNMNPNGWSRYPKIIENMQNYKADSKQQEDINDDDEELVELTIYKTEKSIHYHRYSTTIMVPKKDLVLDDNQIVNDYVQDWEYDTQWDSDEDIEYERVK